MMYQKISINTLLHGYIEIDILHLKKKTTNKNGFLLHFSTPLNVLVN